MNWRIVAKTDNPTVPHRTLGSFRSRRDGNSVIFGPFLYVYVNKQTNKNIFVFTLSIVYFI